MLDNLSLYDNLVILFYFLIVMIIGLSASIGRDKSKKDYFLAGREMGWILVGLSLFATNISTEHLVGLAGSGAIHGFSVGHFEWFAVIAILLMGWVFAPILLRANVFTVPEYFGKRFDQRTRTYLSIISIITYFFLKIGVNLFASGYILSRIIGQDMFFASILIVLFTGIYTVIGGLNSVMHTQIFQVIILLLGALLLTLFGINALGGFTKFTTALPDQFFAIMKPSTDPDLPWTGILFGAPILAIWYWCTDQYIVQRILAAKGLKDIRKGSVLAALLKTVPVLLFIIPGMIAIELFPEITGDEAYPYLVGSSILPSGIKGIIIAGLFAALMSSLSSAFNSAATLISVDLYRPKNRIVTESELVLVGRLSTTLIVFVTIAVIPLLRVFNSQMYIYLQSLQAFISPPIASVFLIGLLWKRASGTSAFWALIIGGFIGLVRILSSFIDISTSEISILNYFLSINYLHFAIGLFVFTGIIMIGITLLERTKVESKVEKESVEFKDKEVQIAFSSTKNDDFELVTHNKQSLNI